MANLDDLFRRSQRTVQPATPPAGQWARILEGAHQEPEPQSTGSFWWGLLAGLLLAVASMVGYHHSHAPAAPPPAPLACAVMMVYDTVRVTVYDRRPTPTLTFSSFTFQPVDVDTRTSAGFTQVEKVTEGTPVEESSEEKLPLSMAPHIDVVGLPRMVASLSLPRLPELELWNPPLQMTTQHVVTPSLGWKGFTRVKKPEVPKGRWEFGVHMTPEIQNNVAVVNLYSAEVNDLNPPQTFNLDGRTETLYYQGTDNVPQRQRVTPFLFTSLEVARQFSSGLRLGLGYTLYSSQSSFPDEADMLPFLFEGEYYSGRSRDDEAHFGTLTAGYTFWKRRKVQVNLAGLLLGQFRRDNILKTSLYSRDDRRLYSIDYSTDTRGNYLFRLAFYPQLTLHYHLNDRLSIGTQIVPGLGVGGRYKLY